MRKNSKKSKARFWRILLLLTLIGAAVYMEQVIVPAIPAPFIPTPTPTRSPASYVLEAVSLFEAGKLDQAEEAYQEAILVQPDEAEFYIALARVQVFNNKLEEAELNARNALLLSPDSADAHAVLGWILDFQGGDKLIEAQESVERALDLNPNSPRAHAYYAEVLMDLGEYEEALVEARTAVQLDPNLLEAQRSLGYVWENTANYENALDAYLSAMRINPNLTLLHLSAGDMYQALGDAENARESYLRAVALSPNDTTPLTRIMLVYARDGEYGIASQYAADAVLKDPSNAMLHGNLGRMYYKNNDYDGAIESLALAIHGGVTETGEEVIGIPLDPGSPVVIEFYSTYGLALAKTARCDLATQIFEALLIGVPDDEVAVFNATEGLRICAEVETGTPQPTLTTPPE
ncbi:MAG: tetratricopeptide repeat protein [Anaerolineales bacterium]|nr:tetratricopeptide repeat protein [Anaerolineales bacterium]